MTSEISKKLSSIIRMQVRRLIGNTERRMKRTRACRTTAHAAGRAVEISVEHRSIMV